MDFFWWRTRRIKQANNQCQIWSIATLRLRLIFWLMPIVMAVIICIHVLSSKYIVWWCIATYSRSIGIVINYTHSVKVNCHFWVLLLTFQETFRMHTVCICTDISYLNRICHYLLSFRDTIQRIAPKLVCRNDYWKNLQMHFHAKLRRQSWRRRKLKGTFQKSR